MASSKELFNTEIEINRKWCKGCGICIAFCPKEVYQADPSGRPLVIDVNKCIRCMLCVERCPDFAIEVNKILKQEVTDLHRENT